MKPENVTISGWSLSKPIKKSTIFVIIRTDTWIVIHEYTSDQS